ncbi:MAG TPA: hypothetical protein VNT30_03025 [Stellaceae bacterium]|nr:hypothetical protein [Stellaceae bacterium]
MLALKLCITPLLILAASLAGRRWGSAVSGWIVGLPLTSGPVSLFLILDQGPGFAQQAAAGTLAGTAAQACFSVAYFWAAEYAGWPLAVAAGACGFLACAAVLQALALPSLALFLIALAALTIGLAVTPRREAARLSTIPPVWDIPARMVVATTLVLSVTAGAAALGPRLSGIFASFPIFAAVLAVFAHQGQGRAAARLVVRGLMTGLYGFACFFATLSLLLTRTSVATAFAAACLAAVLVQGLSLVLIRRRRLAAMPSADGEVAS